jgi:uncharacterized membrane protein
MKKLLSWKVERLRWTFTMDHWLVISCSFSVLLLSLRAITTGRLSYCFLAWNLFLALIPFLISTWLSKNLHALQNRAKLLLLVFIWLLFMPNCFYILTDLFHLENLGDGHPWFDLTLILSFAWGGILFGILSIRKMEKLLRKAKGKFISSLVICTVMCLNAFGIYLGRFLRFNSWDVLANPFALFGEIAELILNPFDYRHVWATSFCFALFMIILYYSSKKLSEPDG